MTKFISMLTAVSIVFVALAPAAYTYAALA